MATRYTNIYGHRQPKVIRAADTLIDRQAYSLIKPSVNSEIKLLNFLQALDHLPGNEIPDFSNIAPETRVGPVFDDAYDVPEDINTYLKSFLMSKVDRKAMFINMIRMCHTIFAGKGGIDDLGNFAVSVGFDIFAPEQVTVLHVLRILKNMGNIYLNCDITPEHVVASQMRLLFAWKHKRFATYSLRWNRERNSFTSGAVIAHESTLREYFERVNFFGWISPNFSFGGQIYAVIDALIAFYFVMYGSFRSEGGSSGPGVGIYSLPSTDSQNVNTRISRAHDLRDSFIVAEMIIFLIRGFAPKVATIYLSELGCAYDQEDEYRSHMEGTYKADDTVSTQDLTLTSEIIHTPGPSKSGGKKNN